MKIYKSKPLTHLPEVIEGCRAPIYLVLDSTHSMELKPHSDAMALFRRYCCDQNSPFVELRISDAEDVPALLSYLVGA